MATKCWQMNAIHCLQYIADMRDPLGPVLPNSFLVPSLNECPYGIDMLMTGTFNFMHIDIIEHVKHILNDFIQVLIFLPVTWKRKALRI